MPAIQLNQLRQQSAQLANLYDRPEDFVRSLHSLLDIYANRTHRQGQSGQPPPLIKTYHVPKPVIRQVFQDLRPYCTFNPETILVLCDALWEQPFLEFRLLVAFILGTIPSGYHEQIFLRVERWGYESLDEQVLRALTDQGLRQVSHDEADILLRQIEAWIGSDKLKIQRIGLRALPPILTKTSYENLPVIFRILSPLVRTPPSNLKPDILEVLKALSRRSPPETAYFLRQNLEYSDHPDTGWLTRQCLVEFPAEAQQSLRNSLRIRDQRSRS